MAVDMDMKILIVDDYQTMLGVLRTLLRQLKFHNIDEASDGSIALEKLHQDAYDLIISDWNMEPVSGLELLRAVRSDEHLRHIPFIMITAEIKTEKVLTVKQAGVSNYIVKPFTAETFKTSLVSVIGDF